MGLTTLISGLAGAVGQYFTDRQVINAEQNKRKDEIRVKKLEADIEKIRNAQESDIAMDTEARSMAGIMDDISFYVFLSPAVLCFWPEAVPHVINGFNAVEKMPQWWQYTLGFMLAAVWGYRRLVVPVAEVIVQRLLPGGK